MTGPNRYRTLVFDNVRWTGYRHRPGDIIISTPPKCGTTWMQNIVGMLVLGTTEFDRPMAQLSPWVDQCVRSVDDMVALTESLEHRRFVKSHTPLDGLPWHDDVTYIAVGRDPRDVAVSWQDHWDNMDLDRLVSLRAEAVGLDDLVEFPPFAPPPEDRVERFWQWMTTREVPEFSTGLQFLVLHLRSFWERRHEPNVVLVHYADLQADLTGEMRRLAERLDVRVTEDDLARMAEAATFESMRSRPEELAPNAGQIWKDISRFFSQGGSGRWRALIDDSEIGRYDDIVRELSTDDEFLSWLHRP